jgi:hypothetical protein
MDGNITSQKLPGKVTIDGDGSLFLVEPSRSSAEKR